MAFVKIYSVSQLSPGCVTEIMFEGEPIALCNAGGEIRALAGICPHQGAPLGHGAMNGENVICPWHDWEFNCRTGRHLTLPYVRLITYPVRIEGDDIMVDDGA